MKIYTIDVYKNWICHTVSYWLPARLVYYVVIRAYAYTSTHECENKTPDEIGYSDIARSWGRIFKANK